MDFSIPEELEALVESVRRFREKELMPHESEFLLNGKLENSVLDDLEERARRQGFWALDVPDEYGGQGLSVLGSCLEKKRYLYPTVEDGLRSCYAFTEPDTGSDLARIRRTAVADGDHWVINGTKIFISEADRADLCILFASTDPSHGAKGVTCFLVDVGTPGFTLSRPIPTMGDGWEPYELSFENCVIPDNQRLGEVNEGWKLAYEQLTHGRLKIAAYQLGIAQRSIDIAVEWAKQRVTWGRPIATRQAVQWQLADSVVELDAARMLVYRAAWLAERASTSRTRPSWPSCMPTRWPSGRPIGVCRSSAALATAGSCRSRASTARSECGGSATARPRSSGG